MQDLFALELAVLSAIAHQIPELADTLANQQLQARVTARENTGAGFYTTLDVASAAPIDGVTSPLGEVWVEVAGLKRGMGFLLWLRDGHMHQLEGYSYEEDTSGLDFERVGFGFIDLRT